jgi:hypothetical protein
VAERPVVLPPIAERTFVLPNGVGWYWEINDSEGAVLERGVADEHARARAHAFAAAFERQKAIPEPYPEGKKRCPDTFSI